MYKAIVFDFFEVLIQDSCWLRICANASSEETIQLQELNRAANIGEISWQDFCEKLAQIGGIPTNDILTEYSNLQINETLHAYIKNIKSRYSTALFTNASSGYMQQAVKKFSLDKAFDYIVVSSEIRDSKPNVSAFKKLIEIIGQDYQDCVFVDDNKQNIEVANSLGIHALQYQNTNDIITNLDRLLNV